VRSAAALILLACGLARLALAEPRSEQYVWPSLPLALQKVLTQSGKGGHADTVYDVLRFRDGAATLWLLSGPVARCKAPPLELVAFEGPECPVGLYLEERRTFRHVGDAHGTLASAAPESGLPTELRFSAPLRDGAQKQERLQFGDGGYDLELVPARLQDPLTNDVLSPEELHRRASEDLDRGYFPAAAGRLAVLCQLGCDAERFELLGLSSLKTGSFARAEAALRQSVTLAPDKASAWLTLGDTLVAEGKDAEARKAYAQAQRDPTVAPRVKERLDILNAKKK
jgi:Tetratricopeptide repeat